MAVTLKRLVGEGGAGLDDSNGCDNLYDVLNALVTQVGALTTSLNQFIADYNDVTPVQPTTALAVTTQITAE